MSTVFKMLSTLGVCVGCHKPNHKTYLQFKILNVPRVCIGDIQKLFTNMHSLLKILETPALNMYVCMGDIQNLSSH